MPWSVARTTTIIASMTVFILSGCSTVRKASWAYDQSSSGYREAYGVYPAAAGNGVTKHLVRSHTTAILVRPVSSTFELCTRLWDQVWDWGRRLDVRFVRFPVLNRTAVPGVFCDFPGMDLVAWEQYLDRLTGESACQADLEFLIDGEDFYTAFENAIDGATNYIDLQVYLFDNDDVARGIADRLRARSTNIEVRIMCDGLGTYLSHMATSESQPTNCVPIDNLTRYLCRGSDIRLRVIPNPWLSGNHIKCMIFDRRMAFIGGMNIGREYRYDWHDLMIRIEGEAVNHLTQNFDRVWRHNGWGGDFSMIVPRRFIPAESGQPGRVPVRFLHTRPTGAQIYRAQLEAIRRARAYIYIENCYLADDRILYELCRARLRGVDVRVILPGVVNHKIMEHSNRVAINTLICHGVRVYIYPGMSHVKAAVYDGWACFGTANFDKLSLQIIRELNMATSDPQTVQTMLDMLFMPDFAMSTEVVEPIPLNLRDHLIELVADET